METYFIILLWVGLLLLFWCLSKGLAEVEASIELNLERAERATPQPTMPDFDKPDAVADVIGQYMNTPIYRKVTIGPMEYHFDRILMPGDYQPLASNERSIEPGIVYVAAAC